MRNPRSQTHAIELRKRLTDAERKLWRHLRQRQIGGLKFRRQYPIGPFVVDFVCVETRLVVELDGGQHNSREASDGERTRWLEQRGYRVLRFWNDAVLLETGSVLQLILDALAAARPHPNPPPQAGEGSPRPVALEESRRKG